MADVEPREVPAEGFVVALGVVNEIVHLWR